MAPSYEGVFFWCLARVLTLELHYIMMNGRIIFPVKKAACREKSFRIIFRKPCTAMHLIFLQAKNNAAAAIEAAPMISGFFFNLSSEVYNLSFNIKLMFCGRSANRRIKYPNQSCPNGKYVQNKYPSFANASCISVRKP